MMSGMRAFRFALFTALLAGLLSAAAYLWVPLVAPKAPQLRLAAPSIRSRVLEPPFRIPPVSLELGLPGHLLPAHVAGAFVVRRPHVPVAPRPAPVVVATPTVTPQAPAVVHRTVAPRVVPKPSPPAAVLLPVPTAPEAPPTPVVTHPTPPPVVVPTPTPLPQPAPVPAAPVVVATPAPAEAAPQAAPIAPATPPAPTPTPAPSQTPPPSTVPPPTAPGPTPTPVPTPPPVTPDTRPGWGCGDKNHDHTGPAGQTSPCNK